MEKTSAYTQRRDLWGKRSDKEGKWKNRKIGYMEYQKKRNNVIEQLQKVKLDVLAIIEIKMERYGITRIKNDHVIIYNGVENNERTREYTDVYSKKEWNNR